MALQTSGTISLNDIHVEAGGTSGTQASINDSDIRGLIGKASGTQMAFNEWYGASSSLTLDGTGTYYDEYHGYSGTYDRLRTRATGNASYPYIGVVREPYTGSSTYYWLIQGNNVAAVLNAYSNFGYRVGAGSGYSSYSVTNWTTFTYSGTGEVITYATPGSALNPQYSAYLSLSGNTIHFNFS